MEEQIKARGQDPDKLILPMNGVVSSEELVKLIEGYKDYMELLIICSCRKLLHTAKKEIGIMLGGSDHPSNDTLTNSKAINYQFQLVLTAKFELSKLNIKMEEPDFSFIYNYKNIFCSC